MSGPSPARATDRASSPTAPSKAVSSNALPSEWKRMWGDAPNRVDLREIQTKMARLARAIELRSRRRRFGPLVGSNQLRDRPVHRWYAYKEGYSPDLLGAVIAELGLSDRALHVSDVFGGVATTAVAALQHKQVAEVRSLEYSPWAHFVGATKLSWPSLSPERLRKLVPAAVDFTYDSAVEVPPLSTLSNQRVIHSRRVRSLLSARNHLEELSVATKAERDFLLLGLGAVIEDLSYAMKDGRALRVRGTRRRRRSSLCDHPTPIGRSESPVRAALLGQWSAMIEDLEVLGGDRGNAAGVRAEHLQGDARSIEEAVLAGGHPGFPKAWSDLSCFSPPYLNCIDYSELYKLELWIMGLVTSQRQFRETRLGTLRSHPSVKFDARDSFAGLRSEPVVELIAEISAWLTEHSARKDIGPVVQTYFEDMYEVWQAQVAHVKPGASAVCVVANSTFSRRRKTENGNYSELWRLPLLTDVILAHLALLAGFESAEIWDARTLRPRNVKQGEARESLVVATRFA